MTFLMVASFPFQERVKYIGWIGAPSEADAWIKLELDSRQKDGVLHYGPAIIRLVELRELTNLNVFFKATESWE